MHKPPAGGKKPHIVFVLFDDYGWADANWHRTEDPSPDVQTPTMDALVSLDSAGARGAAQLTRPLLRYARASR